MTDVLQALAPTEEDLKVMETPPAEPAPPTPASEPPVAPPPVIPPTAPPATPPKDTPEVQIEKLNAALRETRNEMRTYRDRAGKIDDIKTQIEQWQREKTEASKPKVPAFEEDPIGHQQAVLKEIQENQQRLSEQTQNIGHQTQMQQLITAVQSHESDFRRAKPDYDAAQKFVTDARRKELEIFGITDEQVVSQDLAQNAFSLSMSALQNGKNPAEVLYNIALQRGYKASQPVIPSTTPAVAQQQATLESIQRGQAAAQTLTGKGDSDVSPTLQALLDAPVGSQEFDKQWNDFFGIKK